MAFKIWTTPRHLARWWGPKDFTSTIEKLEFREGGAYRHTIHKDDHHHGMSGVYREIVVPERIVFTFAWDNEIGQPGDETLITVTFEAVARKQDPRDLPAGAVRQCREPRLARRQAGANASTAWKPISTTQ